MENRYGFGEQDIEYFSAKLQTKAERDVAEEGKEEDEEKRYVEDTQYNQEDMEKFDMHALNLFGIPLEEALGKDPLKNTVGTNQET